MRAECHGDDKFRPPLRPIQIRNCVDSDFVFENLKAMQQDIYFNAKRIPTPRTAAATACLEGGYKLYCLNIIFSFM